MSKRRKVKGACIFKRHGVGPWRIAYTDTDLLAGKRRRREYSTRQGDYAVACQEAERLLTEAAAHARRPASLPCFAARG